MTLEESINKHVRKQRQLQDCVNNYPGAFKQK